MKKKGKNRKAGISGAKNRAFHRTLKVKRRAKDLDQIQDQLKVHDPEKVKELDQDLPGLGQFYCLACA
jgi:bud site selection protein 20